MDCLCGRTWSAVVLFLPLASADDSSVGRGVHDACLLCEAKALVRWHGLILGEISQKLTTEFGRYKFNPNHASCTFLTLFLSYLNLRIFIVFFLL